MSVQQTGFAGGWQNREICVVKCLVTLHGSTGMFPPSGALPGAGRSQWQSRKSCQWHHMALCRSCLVGQSTGPSVVTGRGLDLKGGAYSVPSWWSFGSLEGPGRASYLGKEMGESGSCVHVENHSKAEEKTIGTWFWWQGSFFFSQFGSFSASGWSSLRNSLGSSLTTSL